MELRRTSAVSFLVAVTLPGYFRAIPRTERARDQLERRFFEKSPRLAEGDLCEPAGVRFLGFGSDPAFGNCVDGLICLGLAQLAPAKRKRYLGLANECGAAQVADR
jgi:hypothetical protein